MASLLYGVSPADPVTYAGFAAFLVAVSLLAAWFPARRATRVDPVIVLREE
jgi:ABC-type antimicrobial peptide transport system permease subunit